MILYSSSTCPKCKVLKMKLDKIGVFYSVNENIEEMTNLGIKSLPVLQTSTGRLLDFPEAVKFVRELEQDNQEAAE